MYDIDAPKKIGYLNNDFKFFHLKDKISGKFEFHYHDFNKIVILLSGKVTYIVEGKSYFLKPWDILLVSKHAIHKPIIDSDTTYERIVIWANSNFIEKYTCEKCNLLSCFNFENQKMFNLIRLDKTFQEKIKNIILELDRSTKDKAFASELLSTSLFIQFIIYLNRIQIDDTYLKEKDSLKFNKQIDEVIQYINSNLNEDLSSEVLANKFFISKYYLMHKFKNETGYTLHKYILQKRLFKAKELIENGCPIKKASEDCGFNDYSSFLRSFKKMFSKSPKNFKEQSGF